MLGPKVGVNRSNNKSNGCPTVDSLARKPKNVCVGGYTVD